MASYQGNYDAQSYQVNPYQAPAQEMVQAIQTRNQYWDSAATAIKGAYQNYLNLDLTRDDNHQKLNELMNGVNQQLKQVTQTDLSLGENYGKALSVFDPITKDDNIMGDNAITRHYKDQFSVAQSYRIKDNGKGYSDTNVRDLSNHLQDFASDPNAANWRQHYSQRSFYSPYYDVAAETRQIDKDFKPDVTQLTTPQYIDADGKPYTKGSTGPMTATGYMLNETDKSIVASQYRAFLDAHLSDKAKDQLSIDGRVKYHGNIGALAQDYTAHNQEKIDYYNKEMKDLDGRMAGATDGQKTAYRSQSDNYKAMVNELTLENTKMHAGDFSNLTPYKDQIASSIYTNQFTDYLSKASARKDIDIKYTPDQVWKTMYQESNENKRFNIAKDLQWDIAKLNNETKLAIHGLKLDKNGQPLTGIAGYGVSDHSNDENFGADKYAGMRTQSGKDYQDAVDQMNRKIAADKGIDPTDEKVPKATRDAAVAEWQADPRNKADMAQYNEAAAKKGSEDQMFSAIDDFVSNKIKTENPTVYNGRQNVIDSIKTGDTLNLRDFKDNESGLPGTSNPTKLSLKLGVSDIQGILNGTNSDYKLSYRDKTFAPGGLGGQPTTGKVPVITYKGKDYDFDSQVLSQNLNRVGNAFTEYQSKRNEILNQNINRVIGKENLYQTDKNPYYQAVHNIAGRLLMGSDEKVKPEDVVPVAKDREGNVYVKVQADKNIKEGEIKTRIEAEGGKYIKGDDEFMIPADKFGTLTNSQRFSDPKLQPIQTLVDFRSAAKPNDRFNTAPQAWGGRNFQFKVDMNNGHPSYRVVDPYTGAQFGKSDSGDTFVNLEDAAAAATYLGNLPNADYTNKVKTIGGVPGYQPK